MNVLAPVALAPSALATLCRAHVAAHDLNQSPIEFACQLANLIRKGVDESDLRHLVSKGLVAHLIELTDEEDRRRRFRSAVNLRFSDASCFVLTADGLNHVHDCRGRDGLPGDSASRSDARQDAPHEAAGKPHYDLRRRTLFLGSVVVKCFRVPALNQELILQAFEEEGWPPKIFDPLPQTPGIDPKKRLHDATHRLNGNQRRALLTFHGDGTAKGIAWRQIDVGSAID